MARRAFGWLLLLCMGCIGDLPGANCPEEDVLFAENLTPLVRRDCASCHSKGEYGVRLEGEETDYGEVMRYVVPYRPGRSTFLAWAAGDLGWHPASWPAGSDPLACATTWIDEGATPETPVVAADL